MKNYLFMRSVLTFIGEGRLFTGIVAGALRVLAVLLSLGALIAWLQMWRTVFNMGYVAILGGLLFQVFFVVGVYMVVHTFWIRAADIQVVHAPEFTVIPILSILLKMLGEVYACISLALGVGGGVAALFGDYLGIPGIGVPQSLLYDLLGSRSPFIAAVLLAVGGAIAAVVWLFLFYVASEMLVALVDIARNTRTLRGIAERHEQTVSNQ